MAPEYVTVYQISERFPDLWFASIGLIPLIAGIVLALSRQRFSWKQPNWLFIIGICFFGLLWTAVAGPLILKESSDAYAAYQRADYSIVEGPVSNFQPMPYEGHQDECFSVQDQRFCYSDYDIGPGFHNAASHGGPIRSGLVVRIAYKRGIILRLEIPYNQVVPSAESAAIVKHNEEASQQRIEDDPFEQHLQTSYLFTVTCWIVWWNLQWKRAMRFWLRPPYKPVTQYLFRIFFALTFVGAVSGLIQQLHTHPINAQNRGPVLEITGVMCAVVAMMTITLLWMAERKDRKSIRASGLMN